MRKSVKALSLILLIIALIGAVLYFTGNRGNTEQKISPDQQKIITLLGYPEQFVVTYLESGGDDNPQLTRDEIWFYSKSGTKVTFLGGKLAYSEEYASDSPVPASIYRPEDFEFIQDYSDVEKIVGKGNISRLEEIPGVTDEGDIQIYTTGDMVFLFENGYLTYVQTLVPEEDTKGGTK